MLLLLASLASAAAEPIDWQTRPVAAELHPVGDPLLSRWQQNTAAAMSGPDASPLFRSAAEMDVYWRMAAHDQEPPWLMTEQDQERVKDLAWAGATLGLQQTVEQVINRSYEVSRAWHTARTVVSPSVELRPQKGRTTVRVNRGAHNRYAAMAELEEGRRRPPSIRIGGKLRLVEIEEGEGGEEATTYRPGLDFSAAATRLGPVTMRAGTTLVRRDADQTTLDWQAGARLAVLSRVDLLGEAQGVAASSAAGELGAGSELPPLQRAQTGLEFHPADDYNWYVRLAGSVRPDSGEQRVMVTFSRPLSWRVPQDVRRWPLGMEPGALGPAPQSLPDRGPVQLVALVRPPAAETLVDASEPADVIRRVEANLVDVHALDPRLLDLDLPEEAFEPPPEL